MEKVRKAWIVHHGSDVKVERRELMERGSRTLAVSANSKSHLGVYVIQPIFSEANEQPS